MSSFDRLRRILMCLPALAAVGALAAPAAEAAPFCEETEPELAPNDYTLILCLAAPNSPATLTGTTTVSGTATLTYPMTATPRKALSKAIFRLIGSGNTAKAPGYLLTDYTRSGSTYSFEFDTAKYPDGVYDLGLSVTLSGGGTGASFDSQEIKIPVTLSNGVSSLPTPSGTFTPMTPPAVLGQPLVVAAVGDGPGGETNAANVVTTMSGMDPGLVLYLGDVYEKGSFAEFDNWYGATTGPYLGKFKSITNPIIGNHEYNTFSNGLPYFNYWNGVPNWYSYDAGGWHFIALNSNCEVRVSCLPGSPQYTWLQNDLATNAANECTIAYWHHPRLSDGPQSDTPAIDPLWRLLADAGVDIVLAGHDHSYQRWMPLNADLVEDPRGTTSFVVGTGGHANQTAVRTDPRRVPGKFSTKFGALKLTLNPGSATYRFVQTDGPTFDSGTVQCSDDTAPAPTANLTGSATSTTSVHLDWDSSTDNVAVTGYIIYRNGTQIGTTASATLYNDPTAQEATTYTYAVRVRDAQGNISTPTEVAVTTPDETAPTTPTGVSATATTATSITVTWLASTDNKAVTAYDVRRDGAVVASVGASTLSYSDTGVGAGTTHSYEVVARDAAGNASAVSLPASATTPLAPTVTVAPPTIGANGTFRFDASVETNGLSGTWQLLIDPLPAGTTAPGGSFGPTPSPALISTTIGKLPPGTYTVTLVVNPGDVRSVSAITVAPAAPAALGRVRLVGKSARVGSLLRCVAPKFSGWPTPGITFAWLANRKVIRGATRATFRPGRRQAQVRLTCRVTAKNVAGFTRTSTRPVLVRR